MIVNTELAFAYNRGADIGIKRAIKGGYMGRCEMVWTTAGTNRVCPRCLALKDKVVGHTDEDGVALPPLHPRCRCAIMYREVSTRGLSAGNIDTITTEGSPPKIIERIKFEPAIIQKALEHYEVQIVNAPVEHAIIITKTGEVYHCNGDVHGIPPIYFEQMRSKIEGAHVTHNHPLGALENDHTFSNDDFSNFEFFKMARLRDIDAEYLYELNRHPVKSAFELTIEELEEWSKGEIKDSNRLIELLAKINGYGYERWLR